MDVCVEDSTTTDRMSPPDAITTTSPDATSTTPPEATTTALPVADSKQIATCIMLHRVTSAVPASDLAQPNSAIRTYKQVKRRANKAELASLRAHLPALLQDHEAKLSDRAFFCKQAEFRSAMIIQRVDTSDCETLLSRFAKQAKQYELETAAIPFQDRDAWGFLTDCLSTGCTVETKADGTEQMRFKTRGGYFEVSICLQKRPDNDHLQVKTIPHVLGMAESINQYLGDDAVGCSFDEMVHEAILPRMKLFAAFA